MDEGTLHVHENELVIDSGEDLSDGSGFEELIEFRKFPTKISVDFCNRSLAIVHFLQIRFII